MDGVSQGVWVLVGAVALASAFGVLRLLRDGRFRGTHRLATPEPAAVADAVEHPPGDLDRGAGSVLVGSGVNHELGERATLLQFSSAFCAPCRVTRRVLAEVADVVPGVVHVEVDAEQHLQLVRRLGVVRTPTTLILDGAGRERQRAAGAPRKEEVLAGLTAAVDPQERP